MWNICKGKRTGPSFPSCSHRLAGRFADSTTRESLAASQWGRLLNVWLPPAWKPLSSAYHPPQSPPATGGERAEMPNDKSAAFASGQHPTPIYTRAPGHCRSVRPRRTSRSAAGAGCGLEGGLTPRTAARARRADEIRPSGLALRRYLAGAVAPSARPGRAAKAAASPGKSYFSMGPRRRCPAVRARRRRN